MKLKLTESDKPAQKLMLSVPPEVLKHIDALPLVKKGAVTRQRAILAVLKAWIEEEEKKMPLTEEAGKLRWKPLEELARRSKLTIILDENLEQLKAGLKDAGFKIIIPPKSISDDDIKELAEGCAVLTKNSKDFVRDAVRCDYDVIAIEKIKFIDNKPDRTNSTVDAISLAIQLTSLGRLRGNFLLTVYSDKKHKIEALV